MAIINQYLKSPQPNKQSEQNKNIEKMLGEIELCLNADLNNWETTFIEDMLFKIEMNDSFTRAQTERIEIIWGKTQ